MFPFWDLVIAPAIEAAEAKRILEIGALRGETTTRMLDRLGPDSEIHVIDPVPEFDPSEHEQAFPGRYLFHRDLSLRVLPSLPPFDVALIDGDHNWYTVYNELKAISATARAAGEPLPLVFLHDVCWPYGRRDLYYGPDAIPEEFRQPYAQLGIARQRKKLLPRGGLNPTLHNAEMEGGPRNGVMTAVEDFVAEYDRPLRSIVLPIYFGLAVVVEEARLERQPALAKHLDWLEENEGKDRLLELAEETRLQAMLFQHNVFYRDERRIERGADRYLDLLKGALLDEHHLENEVRIDHLVQSAERGIAPNALKLADPARHLKTETNRLRAARRVGRLRDDAETGPDYFPFTTMGRNRLDHLQRCLDSVRTQSVEGDLLECGTGRGGGAVFLRGYLQAYEMEGPTVWVADPFRASPVPGADGGDPPAAEAPASVGFPELQADLNLVRDAFDRFDLYDERVRFVPGDPAETLLDAPLGKIALVRLGAGLGRGALAVLDAVYDRITLGGSVVVEDHADPECAGAVDEFRSRRGIVDPLERADWAGASWTKTQHAPQARPQVEARGPAAAPMVLPARAATKDLSVVVVFYNMAREAARTLHSLTRSYQLDMEEVDYEVIVVENGSDPDLRLDAEFVQSFGPEFQYLDLGDAATASPVGALNRGIAAASGTSFALMIDGAHVLTPRVLRYGLDGLETYAPSIVATQQWYIGPGQQNDVILTGYDQAYEDQLFDEIRWPQDGYQLFHIGHFIGDRDWFDGLWESNCLFASRRLLDQCGAFDESFSMAGGGYTNLELYERLGSAPDVRVTTIIGEGSFHQLHGGTTTNQSAADERRRRIASYAEHYDEIRGRRFRGPGKPIHYVGAMHAGALRTKARRRIAGQFFTPRTTANPGGLPEQPTPIPDELRESYVDAYWHSLAWRKTTWLGRPVGKSAGDLIAYQELLTRVRPDWVVETGSGGNGGRALFFASILELLGHGRVVSVAKGRASDLPTHPRLTYVEGNPVDDATVAEVQALVGSQSRAVLILGARGSRQRTLLELDLYGDLVPVGSYVVIEDTIVGGHPVWPNFGAGPAEAVKAIMDTRGDFAPDPTLETHGITFNPGGFLKRLR